MGQNVFFVTLLLKLMNYNTLISIKLQNYYLNIILCMYIPRDCVSQNIASKLTVKVIKYAYKEQLSK